MQHRSRERRLKKSKFGRVFSLIFCGFTFTLWLIAAGLEKNYDVSVSDDNSDFKLTVMRTGETDEVIFYTLSSPCVKSHPSFLSHLISLSPLYLSISISLSLYLSLSISLSLSLSLSLNLSQSLSLNLNLNLNLNLSQSPR